MAYYTEKDARDAFARTQRGRTLRKSAREILVEASEALSGTEKFDVFLSHCLADAEMIVGIKALLEEQGQTVYVDWVVDKQLDRGNVTPETAAILRRRMQQSASMLFATSVSSPNSKWMPWELGYFDGLRQGRIAVLPLVTSEGASFKGQEYLGLYPVVERLKAGERIKPFITKGAGTRTYIGLEDFKVGTTTFKTY